MKQSRGIGQEPSLSRIILASAILHLLFISFVIIPLKTKDQDFRSYSVRLVGSVETEKKGERSVLKKRKKKRAIAKKALSKKQKSSKQKAERKADISLESARKVAKEIERIRAISAIAKKRKKIREIQIGKQKPSDNSEDGAGINAKGPGKEIDLYYSQIHQKIWQQWGYPQKGTQGLEVIVSIKIAKNGKVVSLEIEKPSGNILLDRSAIKAITKASPLPPPPEELEIGVRFHL